MRVLAIPEKDWSKASNYLLHQGAWWGWASPGIKVREHFVVEINDDKHASYILIKYAARDITEYRNDFIRRKISSTTIYFDKY